MSDTGKQGIIVRAHVGEMLSADQWNDMADLVERTEALANDNRMMALDAQIRLLRARRFFMVSIMLTLADLALLGRSLWGMYGGAL